MAEDFFIDALDKGGVFVLAIILIWRIETKVDKLITKITELRDAVREAGHIGKS